MKFAKNKLYGPINVKKLEQNILQQQQNVTYLDAARDVNRKNVVENVRKYTVEVDSLLGRKSNEAANQIREQSRLEEYKNIYIKP